MAIYKVEQSGNAPKGATVGDTIVTGGGTYEVLDGSAYKNLSASQLKSMGVGYNPSSGLYSRKISSGDLATSSTKNYNTVVENYNRLTSNGSSPTGVSDYKVKTVDTSKAEQYAKAYNDYLNAQLDTNYYNELSDLSKTYNSGVSDLNKQKKQVVEDYVASLDDLDANTWNNYLQSLSTASSRGLTNSAQGLALTQSVLQNAANNATTLETQKNSNIANIELALEELENNYNVDRNTAAKILSSSKIANSQQAQAALLEKLYEAEQYNASAENEFGLTKYQLEAQAKQAEKERLAEMEKLAYQYGFEDEWKKMDRETQLELANISANASISSASIGANASKYIANMEIANTNKWNEYSSRVSYVENAMANYQKELSNNADYRGFVQSAGTKYINGEMTQEEFDNTARRWANKAEAYGKQKK